MFRDLINLFTKPQDQVKQSIDQTEVLALTAIFIRLAKLDGSFDINEREKIKELIKKRFEFNDEKTENVLNMAARLEGQSNDNVQFIRVIKESLKWTNKKKLIAQLLKLNLDSLMQSLKLIKSKRKNLLYLLHTIPLKKTKFPVL